MYILFFCSACYIVERVRWSDLYELNFLYIVINSRSLTKNGSQATSKAIVVFRKLASSSSYCNFTSVLFLLAIFHLLNPGCLCINSLPLNTLPLSVNAVIPFNSLLLFSYQLSALLLCIAREQCVQCLLFS